MWFRGKSCSYMCLDFDAILRSMNLSKSLKLCRFLFLICKTEITMSVSGVCKVPDSIFYATIWHILTSFLLLKHTSVRFNRSPILHSSSLTGTFDRSSLILQLYSPSGREGPLWIKSKAMASHNSLEYVNFAAICLVNIPLLPLAAWPLMSHWVCLLLCCLIRK